jgi:hypothetical protein
MALEVKGVVDGGMRGEGDADNDADGEVDHVLGD